MQNKSKLNTILLVIIIILLAVGLFYIISNSSKQKKKNISVEEQNIANKQKDILAIKNYKNTEAGYSINYPENWYGDKNTNSAKYNYFGFNIKNKPDAILAGSDFGMKSDGSMISISVSSSKDYLIIDDFINNADLPEAVKASRLSQISEKIIGGKILRAWEGKGSFSIGYTFIDGNKVYDVHFVSGSQKQYEIDYKVFTDLMSSFVFL